MRTETQSDGEKRNRARLRNRAYALLDVVLAVALFALAATGLIQVMQRINETSTIFARDRLIQDRLGSLLDRTRKVPVGSMNAEFLDPDLDVTFRTYAESYQIDNGEGAAITGIYRLTAEASFRDDGGDQVERIFVLVHEPED